MIKPTVGRIVHYYPSKTDDAIFPCRPGEPLAAIISYVRSDTCVNLCVIDANGNHRSKREVLLVQPDSENPGSGGYCTWMPYQVGQAAKLEVLERKLAASA